MPAFCIFCGLCILTLFSLLTVNIAYCLFSFQACLNKKVLSLFYDSVYTGRSTPTIAFDGAIWHIVYTMLTH